MSLTMENKAHTDLEYILCLCMFFFVKKYELTWHHALFTL